MKLKSIVGSLAIGALLTGGADAAVVVNLTNPGASTVNVGDTITARIFASTNNANGIAALNVRVSTSTASIGGVVAASPFLAVVQPTSGTTGSSSVVTAFNPDLVVGNTTIVSSGTATFVDDADGDLVPNSTTGNRPVSGFNGNGTGGRAAPKFFSSDNASLTWFADVSFKAIEEGTLYFGLSPNTPTATEYSSATLGNITASTATVSLSNGASGTGFAVNVVPEPASAALLGLSGAAMLGWRNRHARRVA